MEKAPGEVDETASDSSNSSPPIALRATSSSDLKPLDSHTGSNANIGTVGTEQQQPVKLKQSLEEHSRIPYYSFFVTLATVLSLQYSVGFWRIESFVRWKDSCSLALGRQGGMLSITCSPSWSHWRVAMHLPCHHLLDWYHVLHSWPDSGRNPERASSRSTCTWD
jgi:hypothetical protein